MLNRHNPDKIIPRSQDTDASEDKRHHLDAVCRDALAQANRILQALNLEMTTGGEIEWYVILPPDRKATMTAAQAADALLADVSRDPLAYKHSLALHMEDGLLDAVMRRSEGQMTEAQAIMEIAQQTAYHMRIGEDLEALSRLLFLRVEKCATESGIPVHSIAKEAGYIWSGNGIFAQQLEVSTGVDQPEVTAQRLDALRSIIIQESKALGLLADMRSYPHITVTEKEASWSVTPAPNSQHIHFGLRFRDTQANALVTSAGEKNLLSAAIDRSTLGILADGGVALICPTDNDFERLRSDDGTPKTFLRMGEHDSHALLDVPVGQKGTKDAHKELKTVGANTPGSAAVLLPVAATVDALLQSVGKAAKKPSYLGAILSKKGVV